MPTSSLAVRPQPAGAVPLPRAGDRRPRARRTVARAGLLEALRLGLLLAAYQASRLLGGRDVAAAFENARAVLSVQQRLGLPAEQDVQSVLLAWEPLVRAANGYYAAAHLPVTVGVLLWLYLRRPLLYRRARAALVGGTAVALAVYLLIPVAPPRMLPGFVDTATVYGQSVYGNAGAGLANQYAALPSLHVGWAVLVALACCSAGRWRGPAVGHAVLTVAVVVGTANHWWVDALAGAGLVVLAWLLAGCGWVGQPSAHRAAAPLLHRAAGPALHTAVTTATRLTHRSSRRHRLALATGVLALSGVLIACGDNAGEGVAGSSSAPSQPAQQSARRRTQPRRHAGQLLADLAQDTAGLPEHHEGAVEAGDARLADGSSDPALRLAQQLRDAQATEVTARRARWGRHL